MVRSDFFHGYAQDIQPHRLIPAVRAAMPELNEEYTQLRRDYERINVRGAGVGSVTPYSVRMVLLTQHPAGLHSQSRGTTLPPCRPRLPGPRSDAAEDLAPGGGDGCHPDPNGVAGVSWPPESQAAAVSARMAQQYPHPAGVRHAAWSLLCFLWLRALTVCCDHACVHCDHACVCGCVCCSPRRVAGTEATSVAFEPRSAVTTSTTCLSTSPPP